MSRKHWNHVKRFVAAGQAIVPVYMKERGKDCVKIFYKDGTTEILEIHCDSFLKKILSFFGTTIPANRDRYGALVSKKQLVPIALSYGFTLVPYIVRQPIGRETRYGWVVAKEMRDLQAKSSSETIIELSHHEIPVYHTKKFCLNQLKDAKLIGLYYSEIHEPHRQQWSDIKVENYEIVYS